MNTRISPYSKAHPFQAKIKERFSLSKPGSKKHTYHISLDLQNSGLSYLPGDSIGVYPLNDSVVVETTLKAMGAKGDEIVTDKQGASSYALREFLLKKANISEISRKLIMEMALRQTNPAKKDHFAWLTAEGNKDALKAYQESHQLWDALEENPEVRFSLQELCHMLMPLLPRLYSIASSQHTVGEEVHLTVALTHYSSNGHERFGVCTHYLCNLAPTGVATVPIYVQPSHGFALPQDPRSDIIMIGPGTGVAPFRAFMQERMALNAPGNNWLFFGEWNRAYDYFYEDFWTKLQKEGKMRMDTAFSRDQEHKIYVQHRMLEHAEELFAWIDKGAYVYVCGDAHRMAKDVDAALHNIVLEQGRRTEQEAKEYMKKLRSEKRYLRDVY